MGFFGEIGLMLKEFFDQPKEEIVLGIFTLMFLFIAIALLGGLIYYAIIKILLLI